MSEVIQALFIRETETRQQPKPHTIYKIEVHAAVRTWTVWKRYSEFTKLNEQLCSIYPDHPPPVSLPKKSLFFSTFGDQHKIEDRRLGLEEYIRGILSCKDDRWRQTDIWCEFLAIPTGRGLDHHNSNSNNNNSNHHMMTNYTSESWLDEYQDMNHLARETKSLINKRSTHIARNEISASHNCTLQAKKLLITLASRIASLESGLKALAQGGSMNEFTCMSEGELRRRQDLLMTLKEEKDTLLKLVSTGRQEQDLLYTTNKNNNNNKNSINNNSNNNNDNNHHSSIEKNHHDDQQQQQQNNNTNNNNVMKETSSGDRHLLLGDKIQRNSTGGRAFGAAFKQQKLAKETEVTRGLDNEGIVGYQRQLMEDQDHQVEQFSAILNRQKQLGYAIGDELDTQNQLLDELDNNIGRTQTKLKFANKKLTKIK